MSQPFHHGTAPNSTRTSTTGYKKARRSSFVVGRRARDHTVTETEDAFQLFVDLPGVKAADISLKIDDGILKISGSRKFGRGGQQQQQQQQQSCSTFTQSFSIDEADVDTSKITANIADGVLAVTFAKRTKPAVVMKTIMVTENPHEHWEADDESSKMDITDERTNAKKEKDDTKV